MEVTVNPVGSVGVVTIIGEIDGASAPVAQSRILTSVEISPRIVIDMTQVAYMSSAGVRMLLATYRAIIAKGGKVVLVGLSEELADTLSMTGFLNFFSHVDTLDEGVKAVT